MTKLKIGEFFFRTRSYTPVPFLILLILFAAPTRASLVAGFIVMLTGEAIRIWGVGYSGFITRTRNVGADLLVTNGAYGRLRNPLYLGNFILSLGVCIMFNALMPWMVIYCAWVHERYTQQGRGGRLRITVRPTIR